MQSQENAEEIMENKFYEKLARGGESVAVLRPWEFLAFFYFAEMLV